MERDEEVWRGIKRCEVGWRGMKRYGEVWREWRGIDSVLIEPFLVTKALS